MGTCATVLLSVSPPAVHYPFCCWINGAIDQQQACVSKRTADHSPTARLDTGAPISTAAVRMITDARLGRAAEGPTPTAPDRLTLSGQGAAELKRLEIGRTWRKANKHANAGAGLNGGAGKRLLLSVTSSTLETDRQSLRADI